VGNHQSTGGDHPGLPRIKPGILTPVDLYHNMEGLDEDEVNLSYAKDYRVFQDFRIIFKAFRQLGRNQAPVTYTE
jgi:hypothetical protein